MSGRKGGLGRGLDSLLGVASQKKQVGNSADNLVSDHEAVNRSDAQNAQQHSEKYPDTLPIEQLQRGQYQPRREIKQETLEELAESIRAQGIIQPIVVRPISDSQYEIIAGERRWRAAQLAQLQQVPVIVREVSDRDAMAFALIENIQREDLNPIDEALALQRLVQEFGLTQQAAAEAVGRSRVAVTNLLRLLNLHEKVRAMVEQGQLEMGHARTLLALEGGQQLEAAEQVVHSGLSVRETEKLVQRLLNPVQEKPARIVDPDVEALQNRLSEQLGAAVTIRQGAKGKGKITIQYNSLDELDGILAHVQ